MDLTEGGGSGSSSSYSLQPHLISMAMSGSAPTSAAMTTAAGSATASGMPSLAAVAPDAYVGMRLAAISSSSSSESLDVLATPPQAPALRSTASAFTCAPGEFRHPVAELTDIALDSTGGAAAAAPAVDAQSEAAAEDATPGGLLNPRIVADIANDIADIKRAIAQQRKPLPSVTPPSRSQQQQQPPPPPRVVDDCRHDGNGNDDDGDGNGVWVRMPSPQKQQQQQQQHHHHSSTLTQPSPLVEHSHPFYDAATNSAAAGVVRSDASASTTSLSNGHGEFADLPSIAPGGENSASRTTEEQLQQLHHQQMRHLPRFAATAADDKDYDSDVDTDGLLRKQYDAAAGGRRVEIPELADQKRSFEESRKDRGREVAVRHPDQPTVLIEGLLFRALYLGSTQLITEGQPSKSTRMAQAQEAVGRIKAPDGENQPCVPVDLFISTEKIMVLNTNLQEIMMDHSLKTISYIADIGNVLVFMARRRFLQQSERRQTKIVCHVFETDEAQLVAQSIGHAFQVAYMEFLRANGIEDPGYQLRDMDYQDVLNQQDIVGEELALFSRQETQKEVLVPKAKGESLGVVIVESGWGSMLPTVVLANMQPSGPAARCGQLNIGDQLLAINGVSLVGLPLATCQQHVKTSKAGTAVKLRLVSCPPVVEVLIRRPDVKFQLGFSVQNGVICSLLRGGIAERGGVRVGHRIIEINGQSVVATPHDKIVAMLASGVGEIHMKTMPTSIFRLLTGQEAPHYI